MFSMPEEFSSKKCLAIHRDCREKKKFKSPWPLSLFFTFNMKIKWGAKRNGRKIIPSM